MGAVDRFRENQFKVEAGGKPPSSGGKSSKGGTEKAGKKK